MDIISRSPHKKRIESVDALRAFALFGVIMVHINSMYSFGGVATNDFSYFTPIGLEIKHFVKLLFDDKSRTIFSTLFGISFYLILRNPTYTISKFCWRCVILMCFGLFDKLFSTYDILFWYGLNGLLLAVIVRKMPSKSLLILSGILFILGTFNFLPIKQFDFPPRYASDTYLVAIMTYPMPMILILDFFTRLSIDGSMTLAFFVFGYYLGKSGIIENIDRYATLKKAGGTLFLFILAMLAYKFCHANIIIWRIAVLLGALALSLSFIWLFNHHKKHLMFMINYGKLGLTNYSTQYILGTLMVLYIAIPMRLSIEYVFLLGVGLYTLQATFATLWMKRHRYGPLEWIWRIATNRNYESNRL